MRILPALVLVATTQFVAAQTAISQQIKADSILVSNRVVEAIVYPEGAEIVRSGSFAAPAGRHELVLEGIPETAELSSLRIEIDGAQLLYSKIHQGGPQLPADPPEEAIEALKALEEVQDRVAALEQEARSLRLASDAAEAEVTFLAQLGDNGDLAGGDPEALRSVAQMIGAETRRARQSALEAEAQARLVDRQLEWMELEVRKAEAALNMVAFDDRDRHRLVLGIESAQEVTNGQVNLTYRSPYSAGWAPVYDMTLIRGETPMLRIERSVLVGQETGENWTDVALQLSTLNPSEELEPPLVWSRSYALEDPAPVASPRMMNEPLIEAPVIAEEAPSTYGGSYQSVPAGLAVSYAYDDLVSLSTNADLLRLRLDQMEFPVEVYAAASDTTDGTAYLMARFTNSGQEELLGSNVTARFVDGTFVGQLGFAGLVPGDEGELAFGPIDGLQVKVRQVARSDGDRGLISRSDSMRRVEEVELRNLTGEVWPVELTGARPRSEHDSLTIDWRTTHPPTLEDVDGEPGILRWDFDLAPGEVWTNRIETEMAWPDGKVLR